nr:DUF1801 domain-containing protein [Hanstruepera marina]
MLALRDIILNLDKNITETKKYGMPCFCYKNKMFAYLWTDKKTVEPYILLVEGNYLDFIELETGNRSRMKILRVDPSKDIPIKLVSTILNKAIDLYKEGTIKTK